MYFSSIQDVSSSNIEKITKSVIILLKILKKTKIGLNQQIELTRKYVQNLCITAFIERIKGTEERLNFRKLT